MEIHPSAGRHGIDDADILHAIAHSVVVDDLGEEPDRWLVIGPDRAANLLEVVVMATAEGEELIIHSMPSAPSTEAARTMTKPTHGHTKSGRPLDDDAVDALADEAEVGYEVEQILSRRGKRGRPRLGAEPSTVESVRLDPDLEDRLVRRAEHEGISRPR